MKAPRYIPVWFQNRIVIATDKNQFGYKGATMKSRNALIRLCWRIYWDGRLASEIVKHERPERLDKFERPSMNRSGIVNLTP